MLMVYNLQGGEDEEPSLVSTQEIYEKYKFRTKVETVFDTYKNLLRVDRSYIQIDVSFEGWMFINHLETMLYYKLMRVI